jgi:mRNA interferase MazF
VQDDRFDATGSVTVCAFTGDPTDAPLFRLVIQPDATNVLRDVSRVMVGKVTTVPRTKVGDRIGRLFDEDMIRLNRTLLVFLGLAG